MIRLKFLAAAVLGFALSAAVVHAEPSSPDSVQPNADILANHSNGKNLTKRSLAAMGQAAGKISNVIDTGAQAFGSGVQRVTGQAAALIEHAKEALGVRYRWGGTSVQTGFDCSGFVRAMVEQTVGKLLPHHAASQAAVTQRIDKDEIQPGDLVFFNTAQRRAYSHVGIYMGDGQFIHAPSRGSRVRIDNLSETYWQKHFEGARRVLTDQSFSGNSLASADTPGLTEVSLSAPSGAAATDIATHVSPSTPDGAAPETDNADTANTNPAPDANVADAGSSSGASAAAVTLVASTALTTPTPVSSVSMATTPEPERVQLRTSRHSRHFRHSGHAVAGKHGHPTQKRVAAAHRPGGRLES